MQSFKFKYSNLIFAIINNNEKERFKLRRKKAKDAFYI